MYIYFNRFVPVCQENNLKLFKKILEKILEMLYNVFWRANAQM